jgi:hypothetical protein
MALKYSYFKVQFNFGIKTSSLIYNVKNFH